MPKLIQSAILALALFHCLGFAYAKQKCATSVGSSTFNISIESPYLEDWGAKVIDFNSKKLQVALSSYLGQSANRQYFARPFEKPENVALLDIFVDKKGRAKLLVAAEQEAYDKGGHAASIRFLAELKVTKQGRLKRVTGSSRFQIWNIEEMKWEEQLGGSRHLYKEANRMVFWDWTWVSDHVVDFAHRDLPSLLKKSSKGTRGFDSPTSVHHEQPVKIQILNISRTDAGRLRVTVSAEQDAYNYFSQKLGRVRFTSQVEAVENSREPTRVLGTTRVEVWHSSKERWQSLD